jgi:hydroxymethylbilane synthase
VERGEYDAIVLAAAGLKRLGWDNIISEIFRPDIVCPAVAQGALAIETLESSAGFDACAPLDDPWTRLSVTAERAMLGELGGGCQVPIGAFATLENTEMFLTGAVFSPDGQAMIRYTATGEFTKPVELGKSVARVLLDRGARNILDSVYSPETSDDARSGDGAGDDSV